MHYFDSRILHMQSSLREVCSTWHKMKGSKLELCMYSRTLRNLTTIEGSPRFLIRRHWEALMCSPGLKQWQLPSAWLCCSQDALGSTEPQQEARFAMTKLLLDPGDCAGQNWFVQYKRLTALLMLIPFEKREQGRHLSWCLQSITEQRYIIFAVSVPIIGGHKCCALITWKSYFCAIKEAQSSFLARKGTGHKLLCKSRFREEAPLLSEPWGRTECIHKIKHTWLCYSPPVICGDINMNTRHGCWPYKAYANYTE